MQNTALIIIDVQVALFSNEKYGVYKAEELLSNIRCLIDRAHGAQIPVIYLQHTTEAEGSMVEGSEGWQVHPYVAPEEKDIIILKRTPDSFSNTSLSVELEKRNIKKLIICGLQTEYCIDTTCRRAFSLGYETVLVKDAHSTFDVMPLTAKQIIEHHHRIMADWFATVMPTDQIQF